MRLEVGGSTGVVFDLDDTLYKERDFQESGFRAVLASLGVADDEALFGQMQEWEAAGRNVFVELGGHVGSGPSVDSMLATYRFHEPRITLEPGAAALIATLRGKGVGLGLITDGRSRTQRAKLAALGLADSFDVVVVSEEIGSQKPDPRNFLAAQAGLAGRTDFVFIADNPAKDFVTPNSLGWATIQVDDDGRNIHSQNVALPAGHAAKQHVKAISDIEVSSSRLP